MSSDDPSFPLNGALLVEQICTLGGLGAAARVDGRYAEARDYLQRAIDLVDRHDSAIGPNDSANPSAELAHLTVDLLNELGMVGKFAGWFEEASAAYDRAMDTEQGSSEPRPAKVASLLHNRAGLAHAQGRFVEADQFARAGLLIRRTLSPADPVGQACDEVALAGILVSIGSAESLDEALRITDGARAPDEAGRRAEESASAGTLLAAALGLEHPEVLVAVSIRAAALHRRGRPEDMFEAEDHYRWVIAAKERVLGDHHPDLVPTLVNLATLLVDQRAEARHHYRRAQKILTSAGLADHPTNRRISAALDELDGIPPVCGRNPIQNEG